MNSQPVRLRTERLRSVPLSAVLRAAGAQPDPGDRAKWHTPAGVLSANGEKFYNWSRQTGGGGAIDLAMHLEGLDFCAALRWLAERFPEGNPAPAAGSTHTRQELAIPGPVTANLPKVLGYLVGERLLPDAFLEPLVAAGTLFADRWANAVFLLRDGHQRPMGAELRGTGEQPWKGLAPGSRKDSGFFSVGPKKTGDAVLCESAIDALSCSVLHPGLFCISTAGARPDPAWLPDLLVGGRQVFCGFDADEVGDSMAAAMMNRFPAVRRLRPSQHDWNDMLGR